jgi:hypothetical protein
VEAVKVVDAAGQAVDYPDMSQREETAAVEYINKSIGINLPPAKVPPPHTHHRTRTRTRTNVSIDGVFVCVCGGADG